MFELIAFLLLIAAMLLLDYKINRIGNATAQIAALVAELALNQPEMDLLPPEMKASAESDLATLKRMVK